MQELNREPTRFGSKQSNVRGDKVSEWSSKVLIEQRCAEQIQNIE